MAFSRSIYLAPTSSASLRPTCASCGASLDGFDLVVEGPPGTDPAPWEAAGATWFLTSFGPTPTRAEVAAAIEGLDLAEG